MRGHYSVVARLYVLTSHHDYSGTGFGITGSNFSRTSSYSLLSRQVQRSFHPVYHGPVSAPQYDVVASYRVRH